MSNSVNISNFDLKEVMFDPFNPPIGAAKLKASKLKISDLPTSMIQSIVNEISANKYLEYRASSQCLQRAIDQNVMQRFQNAYQTGLAEDVKSPMFAIMKVLYEGTILYCGFGMRSFVAGSLVPIITQPLALTPSYIHEFFYHFYQLTNRTKYQKLLFVMTFFRVLKCFGQKFKPKNCNVQVTQTKIDLELTHVWLGEILAAANSTNNSKCNAILAMLLHLLYHNIVGKSLTQLWQLNQNLYVYGITSENNKQIPKLKMTVTVNGSDDICELIKNCLTQKLNAYCGPSMLPNNDFKIVIKFMSTKAIKLGSSMVWQINIDSESDDDENMKTVSVVTN